MSVSIISTDLTRQRTKKTHVTPNLHDQPFRASFPPTYPAFLLLSLQLVPLSLSTSTFRRNMPFHREVWIFLHAVGKNGNEHRQGTKRTERCRPVESVGRWRVGTDVAGSRG
jgi:hypothetical protein